MKHALLAAAIIIVLPLAALAEYRAPQLWINRLVLPPDANEPARHTPRYTDGTYLPARLDGTRNYTAADSPLIITAPTVIEADATVIIGAGVLIVAHEHAGLENRGRLELAGSASDPIVLASNEVHPDNQTWNGIITQPGGRTIATDIWMQHASTALTCQPGSVMHARAARLEHSTVGLVAASRTCLLEHSRIYNARDGVIAVGVTPQVPGTLIRARDHAIRQIAQESSRPAGTP